MANSRFPPYLTVKQAQVARAMWYVFSVAPCSDLLTPSTRPGTPAAGRARSRLLLSNGSAFGVTVRQGIAPFDPSDAGHRSIFIRRCHYLE
jgi:hypothetical protein